MGVGMRVNCTDTRRVHTTVRYRNGKREEGVIWGDVRTVVATPEEGDARDALASRGHGPHNIRRFRIADATLIWCRNTYWREARWHSSGGFVSDFSTGWVLVEASIKGRNVKKDGTLGEIDMHAEYSSLPAEKRYGGPGIEDAPDWFQKLIADNDPDITGSPLDKEKTP